jgi:hypothetical protein
MPVSSEQPPKVKRSSHRLVFLLALSVMCALYIWFLQATNPRFDWVHEKSEYYDLLGKAFRHGHLYLPIEPSPELLALADPLDPSLNARYGMRDLVLFNRKYYLYHGAVPALILFSPWLLITGHDLPEPFAVFVFCLAGYFCFCRALLACIALAGVRPSLFVLFGLLVSLGICQSAPFLLQRASVYEVAISGAYCFTGAGMFFLAKAMQSGKASLVNLALCGLMFGLAIGCRPNLLFMPCVVFCSLMWFYAPQYSRLTRIVNWHVMSYALPLMACGVLIGAYNYARFGSVFEAGMHYQIAAPNYFRPTFLIASVAPSSYYALLSPPRLEPVFPFVRLGIRYPFGCIRFPLPQRYFLEPIAGALTLSPLLLAAFAAPILLKGRRKLAIACSALVGSAATIAFTSGLGLVSHRFETDFVAPLLLVACWVLSMPLRPGIRALTGVLVAYSIGANLAIGFQGPYDKYVQVHPEAYVKIARCFSPITELRPVLDPDIFVEASLRLRSGDSRTLFPVIGAGRFGSRYLLSAEIVGENRLRLTSDISHALANSVSTEVRFRPNAVALIQFEYRRADRRVIVSWDQKVVLQHTLPFLITAPRQITLGRDNTEIDPSPPVFSDILLIKMLVNGTRYE